MYFLGMRGSGVVTVRAGKQPWLGGTPGHASSLQYPRALLASAALSLVCAQGVCQTRGDLDSDSWVCVAAPSLNNLRDGRSHCSVSPSGTQVLLMSA